MISPKTCTVTSQGLQPDCNSSQIPSSEVVNSCLIVLPHRIMRLWLSKDRYDTRNLLIIFIPLTYLNLNQETTWTHSINQWIAFLLSHRRLPDGSNKQDKPDCWAIKYHRKWWSYNMHWYRKQTWKQGTNNAISYCHDAIEKRAWFSICHQF